MGLRTTNRTPLLPITKQSLNNSELPSTSFLSLSTKSEAKLVIPNIFLPSDAAFSGKMAPALTEPLSPTNKLTSSATLASPRPTAANSPLQQNNNNNSQTNNNNNDTIAESIEENSTNVQSNVTQNPSVSEKDKTSETVTAAGAIVTTTAKPVVALAPKPSAPSHLASKPSSKGAFQLAFEQSVGVRKTSTSTSTVVNGGLSTNATTTVSTSQMGPMSNSKASQQPSPLGAANSSPLIKSKITNIDAETAAKIITSQFEDFPSDIEEAITAEICLRQKLKSSEEEQPVAVTTLEPKPDLQLGENLLQEPKKSAIKPQDEDNTEKQTQQLFQIGSPAVDRKEPTSENQIEAASKPLEVAKAALNSSKINIISVQELPPIKTDSTVTASEDDNIEERLKQLDSTDDCQMPIAQGNVGDEIPSTPPRNPSAQIISQITTPTNAANTSSLNSLTPLSTTSTLCGSTDGGQAKDFKDNNSEMDHDIEEDLLQVLKGFDPNTAANDICDLAGFLSEYGMNYEDVNPPTAKENPIKEVQLEIEKNQQTMQRKIDFLSRRLRKLQARYMSKQASEEISGLFEWSARTTKRKNSSSDHQQMSYSEERYHPVTTTTMRSVLKKIEDAANSVQQVSPVKQASGGVGKNSEFTSPKSQVDVVVPTYDEKVTEEIAYVSGRLQAEMREVQSAIDSDATASSSGGESADEMVPYNNLSQETMPITKRAAWRYSRDRAAIASRWTWLVSQISDLEFKIRQHTELHQQLRQRKGKVIFIDTEAAGATSTGIGVGPNGYRGALPGATAAKTSAGFTIVADENELEATAGEDAPQGACRTRAFQSNLYRKRKLFQTANVHTISKKAARPSTIKCGCQWPLHPCALCTGRSDPTAPRDLPDTMMKPQRVALLDPGFHPVLSFSEDIANSIFFEKIARDNEWQNRVARSTAKAVVRGALAAQRAAEKEEQRGNHATSGRITPTTPQNSSISSATGTTGKRKYTKRNHQDGGGGSHSTTPLVANKVGKGKKKKHHHYRQQRNRSPDYVAYPRKTTSTTTVNNNHQTLSQQHQSHHRNAEQFNHLPAHSSLNYPNSKNNKIRKLSSASTAAINSTTATTLNHHVNSNNILNSNYHNLQQHHSYNNELNFLHCDSLDGDSSTNSLVVGPGTGLTGRSRTSSPTHGSGHHKYERSLERRNRTSYDIDNIVIPYSVAAATRVELLPYKEIPTPNWRIIDYDAEEDVEAKKSEKNEEESKANANNLEAEDDEQPDEDISDEAMILRHERALTEERRKFQTFLKFPYSTRSRANRRIDSRAESSGANTPDPTSPAPNTPSVGGDQESIPSPLAPSTPMTPLDSIAETGEATNNPLALDNTPSIMSLLNSISRKQERRRTVSTKKEKDEHRRSSTPDPRDLIPPYEPLKFPIPNDLFESMLKMMPSDDLTSHQTKEDCPQSTNKKPSSVASTTTNGFGDKNTCTNTSSQLSSSGGGSVFVAAAQKNVCDQNLNNSLTLKNSQKSTEQQHLHITGEDDGGGAEDGDDVCDEEDEDEEVDPDHFYRGEAVTNGVNSNYQMRAPPAPTTAYAVGGGVEEFVDEFQQAAFMCRNNLLGCSDTESLESENDGDDDPNDPEWKQEEIRK